VRGFGFTCLTCTIVHVLTEVQRLLDHKICILLHIITMTKQHTADIPATVPADSSGAGAPEKALFLQATQNVILDHFNKRWGQGADVSPEEAKLVANLLWLSVQMPAR
jgi:hypothetical protein